MLLAIAPMMEARITSKTSVNFYQNTRRNYPENSHLQKYSRCVAIETARAMLKEIN
jgi:hypothetical protein